VLALGRGSRRGTTKKGGRGPVGAGIGAWRWPSWGAWWGPEVVLEGHVRTREGGEKGVFEGNGENGPFYIS
jgi:hypothetical protein